MKKETAYCDKCKKEIKDTNAAASGAKLVHRMFGFTVDIDVSIFLDGTGKDASSRLADLCKPCFVKLLSEAILEYPQKEITKIPY